MAIKVIGAGLGRTGTHSLKLALEKLTGEPCYHMAEVFKNMDHCPTWTAAAKGDLPDWNEFLTGYGSAVDWPSAAFWKEMSDALPDAIVILSVRDPEEWWASANSTIFKALPFMPDSTWQEMVKTIIGSKSKMDPSDSAVCIAAFREHNETVVATIPAGRLVIWNVKDGWAPLCEALGVPVPDEPFPVSNTREDFQKMVFEKRSVTE